MPPGFQRPQTGGTNRWLERRREARYFPRFLLELMVPLGSSYVPSRPPLCQQSLLPQAPGSPQVTSTCFFLPIVGVQLLSHVWLLETPWTAARQLPLSSTISQSLLKFMPTESVMLSNHLILCHPLLLLSSIFPSIRVFPNQSAMRIRWPKYWGFSTSPSNEHSRLITFRTDWFDLTAVQGILKSLLQSLPP